MGLEGLCHPTAITVLYSWLMTMTLYKNELEHNLQSISNILAREEDIDVIYKKANEVTYSFMHAYITIQIRLRLTKYNLGQLL